MLIRKKWEIAEFDKVNLPEIVGSVDPVMFSTQNSIRVLDMPIYMPDQGWSIPTKLNQFIETIRLAVLSEFRFGLFLLDHYVYITVDQKIVKEGKTGRRAGAHSDAYIEESGSQVDLTYESASAISKEHGEVSHTYVICDSLPTEFFQEKFPLTDSSCVGSLKTFDTIANNSTPITYPCYALLRMDPYVVHRSAVCNKDVARTFVKISMSRKKYARTGNTVNKSFNYDWKLSVRSPHKRNHPWG